MAKIIDITDKLELDSNPVIIVKDEELEVNTDAPTILKIMGLIGDGENVSNNALIDMCNMIFTDDAQKKIKKLNLKFRDYQTLIMAAVDLATGNDGDEEPGK